MGLLPPQNGCPCDRIPPQSTLCVFNPHPVTKMGLSNPNGCGGNFTVFCPSVTRIRDFISVAYYFLVKSLKQVQITALSITI